MMPRLSYSKRDCRGILLLTAAAEVLNIQVLTLFVVTLFVDACFVIGLDSCFLRCGPLRIKLRRPAKRPSFATPSPPYLSVRGEALNRIRERRRYAA